MYVKFKDLKIGDRFRSTKSPTSTKWYKSSSRTARLKENNRVFYFRQNEAVYIPFNATTIK